MTCLKKYDVFTKAIAFLIAFVLWLYVVNFNDLTKDYKIKDLSPVFVGQEQLSASKNLLIVGDYSVDIEVSGQRRDIISLNRSDIKVEVDLSKVTGAGTYELPYTVTLPSTAYTLRGKNPQRLSVKFDEEDFNVVSVKVVTDDIAADGYVVDKTNVNFVPRELKITGLREEIDKVSYVEAVIPQKNVKANISEKVAYRFFDADGNPLKEISSIRADYDVIDVAIPVLKTKELPLSLEIQGSDSFKKYVNYSFSPKTMQVAGEESIIGQMTSLVAGTIKISDVSSGMKKTFTVTPPEGILNLSGEINATAEIFLDGLSKKTVKTTLIELINTYTLPSGYKIKPVTTSLNVDILGTDEVLKTVDSSNVRAVADLQSTVLSRGTHPINVSIVVDGAKETAVANAEDYIIYVEVN
ncbi:MAG: hypothetical protein IKU65_05725 [Oscillospiraceae bacterium]|nr:hypothetical protein [Oscillospiraceae bacterium]